MCIHTILGAGGVIADPAQTLQAIHGSPVIYCCIGYKGCCQRPLPARKYRRRLEPGLAPAHRLPSPTGEAFFDMAAKPLGKPPKYSVLAPWMIRLGGIFDRTTKELYEMLYQSVFDSSKFEKTFNFIPTPYDEGIMATANE